MNRVCLNCEEVFKTSDPRKKFCGKVCRNRFNVRKSLSKPRKEVKGIGALREMIKNIENKKFTKVSIGSVVKPEKEWIDPI